MGPTAAEAGLDHPGSFVPCARASVAFGHGALLFLFLVAAPVLCSNVFHAKPRVCKVPSVQQSQTSARPVLDWHSFIIRGQDSLDTKSAGCDVVAGHGYPGKDVHVLSARTQRTEEQLEA